MYFAFSHIKTGALAQAKAIRERIERGEDINALAKEVSLAKDAERGGKAIKYQESTIVSRFGDEFMQALMDASEGDIIGPVKDKEGKYEVARHEGRRDPRPKPFEEVEQQIRSKLNFERRRNAVDALIESLRNKAQSKVKRMGILSEEKKETKADEEENKK